ALQPPFQEHARALRKAQPVIEGVRPVGGGAPAPRAGADEVDPHLEGAARARSADLDRPDESMALIELASARLESLPGSRVPTRIKACERDRVPGVDLEN